MHVFTCVNMCNPHNLSFDQNNFIWTRRFQARYERFKIYNFCVRGKKVYSYIESHSRTGYAYKRCSVGNSIFAWLWYLQKQSRPSSIFTFRNTVVDIEIRRSQKTPVIITMLLSCSYAKQVSEQVIMDNPLVEANVCDINIISTFIF